MQQIKFDELTEKELALLQEAKNAGARYINAKGSRHVGAALLCSDQKIYCGVNIRRTNTSNSTVPMAMENLTNWPHLAEPVVKSCLKRKAMAQNQPQFRSYSPTAIFPL